MQTTYGRLPRRHQAKLHEYAKIFQLCHGASRRIPWLTAGLLVTASSMVWFFLERAETLTFAALLGVIGFGAKWLDDRHHVKARDQQATEVWRELKELQLDLSYDGQKAYVIDEENPKKRSPGLDPFDYDSYC